MEWGRGKGTNIDGLKIKILRNIMVVITMVCQCKLLASNRGRETIRDLGRFRKESLVLYVCVCVYGIVIRKLLVFFSVSNSMDGSAIPIFINPISFVVITC